MYIPGGELLIILIPLIIGLITGDIVWDDNQFTIKERKEKEEKPKLHYIGDTLEWK